MCSTVADKPGSRPFAHPRSAVHARACSPVHDNPCTVTCLQSSPPLRPYLPARSQVLPEPKFTGIRLEHTAPPPAKAIQASTTVASSLWSLPSRASRSVSFSNSP
jgi:hypothetical protein